MFLARGIVVILLLFTVALVARLYRHWQTKARTAQPQHPPVPASLTDGAERTWVVFTSPYCATCGPVAARLEAHDPGARVVKVDASREPHLADAYSVRTAPTVLLADRTGRVQARLVGADAVAEYVASQPLGS